LYNKKPSGEGVQVIRRAARILEALKDEQAGLSLSQLAQRTELARSTVHRLVTALEAERFVISASPNGGVRLGPALAALAGSAQQSFVLDLRPYLDQVAAELEETVDLAVLDGDQVRFLDQVVGNQRLRAISAVGAAFPAHCTANGKALLAGMPDSEVEALLPRLLPRLTANTTTSRDDLLAELAEVRDAGVAYDREEHTLGICAVGIAVDTATATVAISVPVPAQRFPGTEQGVVAALTRLRRQVAATFGAAA